MATENAVAAVGKICRYLGGSAPGFDVAGALSHWVDALPIVNDQEEAEPVYQYLLSLLER